MKRIEIQKLLTNSKHKPIKCFEINDTFLLGVFQGSFSKFDLLLKFRQRDEKRKSGWSNLRTPKHIHWTVDILLKMNKSTRLTKEFVDFLLSEWSKVIPNKNKKERNRAIKINKWFLENKRIIKKYRSLNNSGEYSIKFLISLAKILMQQEKNNKSDAFMFKKLLIALKGGNDLFKIISTATHR